MAMRIDLPVLPALLYPLLPGLGLLVFVVLLTACRPAPTSQPSPTAAPTSTPVPLAALEAAPTVTPSANWKLVWADEFDAPDGSLADASKWSFSVGGGGWGNGEYQYYTDNRLENAHNENGNLVITARKESFQGKDYTSARLNTNHKGDWLYGRIEVRAKLPTGQGIWPAIWMMPTDVTYGTWPNSGEIDIMELIGKEASRVYGTIHFGSPHKSRGGRYDLRGAIFADDYHIFALEWEENEFRWYVDGYHYQTQTQWFTSSSKGKYPAPFDQRFYLILNVAVGGAWPGPPDETTPFPQSMYVDYVRVYQK